MGRSKVLTEEQRLLNVKMNTKKHYEKTKESRNLNPEKKEAYRKYQREYFQKRRDLLNILLKESQN
jgi:RecA-family ATPase|tara:strand:- start:3888 stop:4085 length:198 start_codon:yes stop_codon:yes gene_type:complete